MHYLFYPLGRFERIKTVLMGTNTPHTCIPGLVWQKQARRFSQFEFKVGELRFPIHFVCVSAALYHRGYAAAIFPLGEYGPFWSICSVNQKKSQWHYNCAHPMKTLLVSVRIEWDQSQGAVQKNCFPLCCTTHQIARKNVLRSNHQTHSK